MCPASFFFINTGILFAGGLPSEHWGTLRVVYVPFSHSIHDLQREKANKIKYM